MTPDSSEITAPFQKAATALGAGAGSSALSIASQSGSFLPTTAEGWMALTASTIAVIYTGHLLSDFYWKKFWRPLFERKGWIKPKRRVKRVVYMDDEEVATE